jgi:zinc protease
MKRRLLSFFVHRAAPGLLAAALFATSGAASAAVQAQQFQLSNGMTLIVQPDHRAPTVVHMVWVRVGSMDEVDGTSGVAHVLEHMMFKGTPDIRPGEFSRRVAALGGRDNAFTSRDATAYHQQVPVASLESVMKLEADRFARNQWDDDEFRRELEVVKEERRQRTEESPRARMFEAFNATVFQASPYRRPVIGWMSDLDAMTPQDARDFYKRWYTPANAAVVIAGDVDPKAVLALAEKHYGPIPARAVPPRKPRLEPVQQGPRRMEYRAVAEQALITMAFKVPSWNASGEQPDAASQDALALTMLSAVLDGYSGAPPWRGGGAGPAAGVSADSAGAALRAEVARIARDGVSEAELRRVKTQWTAGEVYKLDSVFNQARELGSYWVNGMDLATGDRLMAQLNGVTAAQVQAVAGKYFSDEEMTTAVLVPDPSRPRQDAPTGPRPALGRHGGPAE